MKDCRYKSSSCRIYPSMSGCNDGIKVKHMTGGKSCRSRKGSWQSVGYPSVLSGQPASQLPHTVGFK